MVIPLDGGVLPPIPAPLWDSWSLILEADTLYGYWDWANAPCFGCPGFEAGVGGIVRMPTDGGAAATLLDGLSYPTSVAADTTGVYWTEKFRVGALLGDATAPRTLYSYSDATPLRFSVRVDDTSVYWVEFTANGSSIMKLTK
jgi:hypothetical protein